MAPVLLTSRKSSKRQDISPLPPSAKRVGDMDESRASSSYHVQGQAFRAPSEFVTPAPTPTGMYPIYPNSTVTDMPLSFQAPAFESKSTTEAPIASTSTQLAEASLARSLSPEKSGQLALDTLADLSHQIFGDLSERVALVERGQGGQLQGLSRKIDSLRNSLEASIKGSSVPIAKILDEENKKFHSRFGTSFGTSMQGMARSIDATRASVNTVNAQVGTLDARLKSIEGRISSHPVAQPHTALSNPTAVAPQIPSHLIAFNWQTHIASTLVLMEKQMSENRIEAQSASRDLASKYEKLYESQRLKLDALQEEVFKLKGLANDGRSSGNNAHTRMDVDDGKQDELAPIESDKGPHTRRMVNTSMGYHLVTPAHFDTSVPVASEIAEGTPIMPQTLDPRPLHVMVDLQAASNYGNSLRPNAPKLKDTHRSDKNEAAEDSSNAATPVNVDSGGIPQRKLKFFECPRPGCGKRFSTFSGRNIHWGKTCKNRSMDRASASMSGKGQLRLKVPPVGNYRFESPVLVTPMPNTVQSKSDPPSDEDEEGSEGDIESEEEVEY